MDNKEKNFRNIFLLIGIPLVILIGVMLVVNYFGETKKTQYSEIVNEIYSGDIVKYNLNLTSGSLEYWTREDAVTDSKGIVTYPESKMKTYDVPDVNVFYEDVGDYVKAHNKKAATNSDIAAIEVDYEVNQGTWLLSMLPTLLLIVGVAVLWIVMMRRMGGGADKTMGFGKAKVRRQQDGKNKTTFADVAGADEEKEELTELVDFLKNPTRFNDMGARIPKGVLLVGPPGTGKTLLAKAVAGEAKVPFFSISGSDFVEMFVGVGASRVRDLFDQAKKNSPAIVFIDEIDAVGRQRGTGLGGGHDEREQTLNQLLVEMDGFSNNEGVIVMAATNRSDVLDPALLRPGRFDRQIMVGYPDVDGREAILKVHAKGKPFAPDVDLRVIARTTAGFTGADLENLLNEAALLAARNKRKAIIESDIEEATVKVVMGVEKKSRVTSERDKLITSYHEAGHAVVSYFLPTQDEVHQISIIPRGGAAGYTMYRPAEDQTHVTRTELREQLCSLLGGRVAEKLTQNDICTGASNDLKRATEIATKMVTRFGMSDTIGPVVYGSGHDEVFLGRDFNSAVDHSDVTASKIDEEIRRILDEAFERAESILKEHMDKLDEVAKYLVEHEKLDADCFKKIMDGEKATENESEETEENKED